MKFTIWNKIDLVLNAIVLAAIFGFIFGAEGPRGAIVITCVWLLGFCAALSIVRACRRARALLPIPDPKPPLSKVDLAIAERFMSDLTDYYGPVAVNTAQRLVDQCEPGPAQFAIATRFFGRKASDFLMHLNIIEEHRRGERDSTLTRAIDYLERIYVGR